MLYPRYEAPATYQDTDLSRQPVRSAAAASRSRLTPWLVVVALLSATTFGAQPVAADTVLATTATVTSPDGLNLRSGPSSTFDIVAVLPNGAQVVITGIGSPDNWLPVQYNGQLGWANGAYLNIATSTPAAALPAPAALAPAPSADTVATVASAAAPAPSATSPAVTATAPAPPAATTASVVPSDGLNLRSGPGSSFSVITLVPGGTSLAVTGNQQDSWVPVSFNGATGWVNSAYIAMSGSTNTITANAASSTGGATLGPTAGAAPVTATAAASGEVKLIWPVASRRISTVFSPTHLGIDIDEFDEVGSTVAASAAGTVSFAGGEACCSYGLYVIVDHANGMQTLYAHLASTAVQKGQVVSQGQKIGNSGNTGRSTGPHVHFEVRINGKQVDPLRFLPAPWKIE